MAIKPLNALRNHDHWFAEWWSSILMVGVGFYGFVAPRSLLIHQALVEGFLQVLPTHLWEFLFVGIGIFQFVVLVCESLIGRAVASCMASSLLIWGLLNIFLYGPWHLILIPWGVSAMINLYALFRITIRIEKNHEPL